ncbi:MAG: primosomal protein [Microbacteriaceae bacterium]|nr:primosomal protein [Microbacteriaceae bacterium]
MAQEARQSLNQFISALERHFEAVSTGRGSDDPAVVQSYEHLKSAFLDYEESLSDQFGEFLPMELAEDEDDWT